MYSRIEIPVKERGKVILALLPLTVFFSLIFITGIVYAFLQSAGILVPADTPYKGLDSYRFLLSDSVFLDSFAFSLKIALFSAAGSILLSIPLSIMIWRMSPKLRKYSTIYKIPIILPHIAVAFLILLLLSPSGIFSSLLYKLGIISGQDKFPQLLYSSGTGIILAYLYKEIPFAVLMCLGVLSKIPQQMILSAKMLGASPIRIIFKVVLPQLKSILSVTFTILFLYSFGAFDIPYLLGGSRPAMLSIYVFNLYFKGNISDRPLAMAALSIMAVFAVLFVALSRNIFKKSGGVKN